MTQYIDKAAVVAEIERRKHKLLDNIICEHDKEWVVRTAHQLNRILLSLDTLEVKEVENFIWNNARTTVPEDSANQIICIKEDGLAVSTIGKIVNGTVKWAYLDDLLNTNSFNVEVKEVNLEKELETLDSLLYDLDGVAVKGTTSYLTVEDVKDIAKRFFKLGLKTKGE